MDETKQASIRAQLDAIKLALQELRVELDARIAGLLDAMAREDGPRQ